jgi:hypothetical protein
MVTELVSLQLQFDMEVLRDLQCARGMAQVIEYLCNNYKALSSNTGIKT